jgi:cell division inhibitor SepF
VTVTTAGSEESASPTVVPSRTASEPQDAAPSPAWGRTDALG